MLGFGEWVLLQFFRLVEICSLSFRWKSCPSLSLCSDLKMLGKHCSKQRYLNPHERCFSPICLFNIYLIRTSMFQMWCHMGQKVKRLSSFPGQFVVHYRRPGKCEGKLRSDKDAHRARHKGCLSTQKRLLARFGFRGCIGVFSEQMPFQLNSNMWKYFFRQKENKRRADHILCRTSSFENV